MGFKDWFQKKLKQKPPDEDLSAFSEPQENKENLGYVEPQPQYSPDIESKLSHELSDADLDKTSSQAEFESKELEYIHDESYAQDRGSDKHLASVTRDLPPEDNEPISTAFSVSDTNDDYVSNLLKNLPELWTGKEMKLHIIADFRDATWITKKVLQQVESGLIIADIKVKEFAHLCDMTLVLRVTEGLSGFPAAITAINPTLSYLLTTIKFEAIIRRKRRLKI